MTDKAGSGWEDRREARWDVDALEKSYKQFLSDEAAPVTPPAAPMTAAKSSIKTEYAGRLYRSKLEADWARVFDALNIPFEYEDRGRYFGDLFYLVDFWLPKSRQFIEVKGVFQPADCRKICALLEEIGDGADADAPLIAALPKGTFYAWKRRTLQFPQLGDESWMYFLAEQAVEVELFRCAKCQGWWFSQPDASWKCRCCGHYDGARTISERLASPIMSNTGEGGPQFPDMDLLRAIGNGDSISVLA